MVAAAVRSSVPVAVIVAVGTSAVRVPLIFIRESAVAVWVRASAAT